MEEFNQFHSDILNELEEVKNNIKERKKRLVRDVGEFEKSLSKQEASRLKNSRGKILIRLYLITNSLMRY